jgi:hypothetical protein
MDTTFSHEYECEELAEMPQPEELPHYYYSGARARGGRDGLLIDLRPEGGARWLGTFAFGRIAPRGVSGIFATPNPKRVCVVAKGAGYLVSTSEPTCWEPVSAVPVIDVRPVKTRGIIVFASFIDIVAYGAAGIQWRTQRLTWEDMRITEITDDSITGEFWDFRSEATGRFVVDLASGAHRGGVGKAL